MLSVIITSRKKLFLSVGILCLPYAAFGMKEEEKPAEKSSFNWKRKKISTDSTSTTAVVESDKDSQLKLKFLKEFETKQPSNPQLPTSKSQLTTSRLDIRNSRHWILPSLTPLGLCELDQYMMEDAMSPRSGQEKSLQSNVAMSPRSRQEKSLQPKVATSPRSEEIIPPQVNSVSPRKTHHSSSKNSLSLGSPRGPKEGGIKRATSKLGGMESQSPEQEIKDKFEEMKLYSGLHSKLPLQDLKAHCNKNSFTPEEYLRFRFYMRIKTKRDLLVELPIQEKNIAKTMPSRLLNTSKEVFSKSKNKTDKKDKILSLHKSLSEDFLKNPVKVLNNFWGCKITEDESGSISKKLLESVSSETLELIASSAKFLIEMIDLGIKREIEFVTLIKELTNSFKKELTEHEIEKILLIKDLTDFSTKPLIQEIVLNEKPQCDEDGKANFDKDEQAKYEEKEKFKIKCRNEIEKILTEEKSENSSVIKSMEMSASDQNRIEKYKKYIKFDSSALPKQIYKQYNNHIKILSKNSENCYYELSRKAVEMSQQCPKSQSHAYKTAKYLVLIGEYEEAWQHMLGCTLFSDFIKEDYKPELQWINEMIINRLMYLMNPENKINDSKKGEDYFKIAGIKKKISIIENDRSKSLKKNEVSIDPDILDLYLEGVLHSYANDSKCILYELQTSLDFFPLLPHLAAGAASRALVEDIKNKNYLLDISNKCFQYVFETTKKSAEQGDSDAQYNLGLMYMEGRGVEKDEKRAVECYQKAADLGHQKAQFTLGSMYDQGSGLPQNDREAVKRYYQSAEQGDPDAQYNLGWMYEHGRGVEEQDYKEAAKWYAKAAAQQNVPAHYRLGRMYEIGSVVEQNSEEAFKCYQKADEQNYVLAQYALGWMCENGIGVPQNVSEALRYYKKAAEGGCTDAQLSLGEMYGTGICVPKDVQESAKWYRKAAEQGHVAAQTSLALIYIHGEGVPQNYREAFKWCEEAANQGNEKAKDILKVMYDNGRGLPIDDKEAFECYERGVEKGIISAYYNLGLRYFDGRGVTQNDKKAAESFKIAVKEGYIAAQCELGYCYHIGKGVKKNNNKAIKLFQQTATKGNSRACLGLSFVYREENDMVSSDIWYRRYEEHEKAKK